MQSNTDLLSEHSGVGNAELVFALVAPVGTNYHQVSENLCSQLTEFRYKGTPIYLSGSIPIWSELLGLKVKLADAPEYERIETHMKAANELYRAFNTRAPENERNSLLAIDAVRQIYDSRPTEQNKRKQALLNTAHILLTLKRPEEVAYLRRIYGVGLQVISVFATEEERKRYLIREKRVSKKDAEKLIEDDEDDHESGGQRTRDAFEMADLFIDVGPSDDWKRQLGRFLDILFSHPYKTPTKDEQAMFMAYSASLRSAQFGRQVGAAIMNDDGDLLAIGCNEVPKALGGQYWSGEDIDERDHKLGCDSNDREKNAMLDEIVGCLPDESLRRTMREALRKTSLFSITEYGRAVHAEMEALSSCARRGISTSLQTLYTTTFPCHNCARHIVGSGIKKVVYIEPYPKSKAALLHYDSIAVSEEARSTMGQKKVPFVPFVGISPRKYADLFTTKPMYGKVVDRKLQSTGSAISWQRNMTDLRLQMNPFTYIEREQLAIEQLGSIYRQQELPFEGTAQENNHASDESAK